MKPKILLISLLSVLALTGCGTTPEPSNNEPNPDPIQYCEHEFSDWNFESGNICQGGTRVRTCKKCPYLEREDVSGEGHQGEWIIDAEPTCYEPGEKHRTCTVCNQTEHVMIYEGVGHQGEWLISREATCTNEGRKTRTCTRCGIFEDETIEALGHVAGEWRRFIVADTCCAGEDITTCLNCGATLHRTLMPGMDTHSYNENDICKRCKMHRPSEGLIFEEDSNGVIKVTGYTGSDTEVYIPGTYQGKFITAIGEDAFKDNSNITSVTIFHGISVIEMGAFSYCSSLNSLTIPSSVTRIYSPITEYDYALENLYYGGDLNSWLAVSGLIGVMHDSTHAPTFNLYIDGNRVEGELYFNDGIKYIPDYAFYGCSGLTSVVIPEGAKVIGSNAFCGCKSLVSVNIPSSVTAIGAAAFCSCESLTRATLPNGLTIIESHAFSETKLSSVSISGSVKVIESFAFYYNESLQSVAIPYGTTTIGYGAFWGCTALSSLYISQTVTSIDKYSFAFCTSLQNITVESGNTVYASADNCLIERHTATLILGTLNSQIPWSVKVIGEIAFAGKNITSIDIPEGVKKIDVSAFAQCRKLTTVTIPSTIEVIEEYAFSNCTKLSTIRYNGSESSWANVEKASGWDSDAGSSTDSNTYSMVYLAV